MQGPPSRHSSPEASATRQCDFVPAALLPRWQLERFRSGCVIGRHPLTRPFSPLRGERAASSWRVLAEPQSKPGEGATQADRERRRREIVSIRPRHPQHVLADIGEDQVGRDRRGLVEPHFAPFALDVVFLGEGEAAIGLERRVGGVPGRFATPAALPCWRRRRIPCRRRTARRRGGRSCRPPPARPRRAPAGTARPGSGRSAGRRRPAPWRIRRPS